MSTATNKINVAVIGTGLVGAELVNQILALPAQSSPFRIISLTSSKKSLFLGAEKPLGGAQEWKSLLAASEEAPNFDGLTTKLAELVSQNQKVAVVDNTSSNDIAQLYPSWLGKGIHVVTPNKKAYSGELALFEKIIEASKQGGGRFLNESTVGAGLPVISTLKDLVATGDKVHKIEGVFSGTMSYIFNNFSTGSPEGPAFSSIVATAREKGYTEPHPADDLNGYDVARKLTILARTVNAFSSSPAASSALPSLDTFLSVKTVSLIPPALENIPTGDEFISRLPEFDSQFNQLRAEASAEGNVLRFVGVVDVKNGLVKAGLEKYPKDHPFATSLGGSDNIVMFHTERYGARPLIVQGAGAGAAVTAMGVLADLFKLV